MPKNHATLPSDFGLRYIRGFQFPKHIQKLEAEVLDMLASETKNRLVVACSVRHGKSYYTTLCTAAWYLATFPDRDVIIICYNHDFATSWGSKIRDIFYDPQFQKDYPRIRLNPSDKRKDYIRVKGRKGSLRCLGVSSGLAGKGVSSPTQ